MTTIDIHKERINYEQDFSHSHCWAQKSPACGQKIEHLKCCICEKQNPKALRLILEDDIKRLEGIRKGDGLPHDDTMEIHLAVAFTDGFNSALDAEITHKKSQLDLLT